MIYEKFDTDVSKVSIFPRAIWYVYWYQTDIFYRPTAKHHTHYGPMTKETILTMQHILLKSVSILHNKKLVLRQKHLQLESAQEFKPTPKCTILNLCTILKSCSSVKLVALQHWNCWGGALVNSWQLWWKPPNNSKVHTYCKYAEEK